MIFKNAYIYLLEIIDNKSSMYGKFYIGKHNGKNKNYFSGGIIVNNILNKYGPNSIKKTIIYAQPMNDLDLCEKEIYFIKLYDTFNTGLNLTTGGEGLSGYKHSIATIDKMSKSATGHTRQIGIKNSFYGKKHSDITKRSISNTKTGVKMSIEVCKQMSIDRLGIKNLFYGKKHSVETKNKISIANSLKTSYTLINTITSETFIGTINEFYHKYGFRINNITRNKNKKVKEWSII